MEIAIVNYRRGSGKSSVVLERSDLDLIILLGAPRESAPAVANNIGSNAAVLGFSSGIGDIFAWCQIGENFTQLNVRKLGTTFGYEVLDFEALLPGAPSIFVFAGPWRNSLDFAPGVWGKVPVVAVSLSGWQNDVWCDGSIIAVDGSSGVAALIPPGTDGDLEMQWPPDPDAGLPWDVAVGILAEKLPLCAWNTYTSALTAVIADIPFTEVICVADLVDELRSASLLTLLRHCRPDQDFFWNGDGVSPRWRRLLQNLGFLTRIPDSSKCHGFDLNIYRQKISAIDLDLVASYLKGQGGVIPEGFYQVLAESP